MSRCLFLLAFGCVLLNGCGSKVNGPQDVTATKQLQDIANVCFESPVPRGWIVTRYLDVDTCGNTSSQAFNAKEIRRFDDKPVGTTMEVCENGRSSIPSGWVIVSEKSEAICTWLKDTPDSGGVIIKRFE